jgi:hypothetical protein
MSADLHASQHHRWGSGTLANAINLALFLLSILVIAAALNFFAERPGLRRQADATKTRSYSLSEQTHELLRSLEGQWTIALLVTEAETDRAVLRQVDEVLRRFGEASDDVSVMRIDPTSPSTISTFETLLARLRLMYADTISDYEAKIRDGRSSLEALERFIQAQAPRLRPLMPRDDALAASGPEAQLQQLIGVLSLRQEQIAQVRTSIDQSLRVDSTQPIADYESARSILSATLWNWAQELQAMSDMLASWRQDAAINETVRAYASGSREEYQALAQSMALAADGLRRLPALEIASIGRQLQAGDVGIVVGAGRAAIIPSSQILLRTASAEEGGEVVSFDQRFRGEIAIASAIRSLQVRSLPRVVFVHAEKSSMLRSREQQSDLVGVQSMLESARYDVAEWIVGQSPRPPASEGQPTVWVIVPPPLPERQSVAPSKEEYALVQEVKRLLDDGEPVLLSFYPSALHRFNQPDPWQPLLENLGVKPDTSRVIYESVALSQDKRENQRFLELTSLHGEHPIADAVSGQRVRFNLPVALEVIDGKSADDGTVARNVAVCRALPSPSRWVEDDWISDPSTLEEPSAEKRFSVAIPLVVASERAHPIERAQQRVIAVGCGDWMLTRMADVVMRHGGSRVALVYPGNRELLLASVTWLAGMDELIAASPSSREVARLEGVNDRVRTIWRWLTLAVLPLACLGLGVVVWLVRRF